MAHFQQFAGGTIKSRRVPLYPEPDLRQKIGLVGEAATNCPNQKHAQPETCCIFIYPIVIKSPGRKIRVPLGARPESACPWWRFTTGGIPRGAADRVRTTRLPIRILLTCGCTAALAVTADSQGPLRVSRSIAVRINSATTLNLAEGGPYDTTSARSTHPRFTRDAFAQSRAAR